MTIITAFEEADSYIWELFDVSEYAIDTTYADKTYLKFVEYMQQLEPLYESWKKLELFLESINLDELGLVVDVNSKFYKLFEENK